VSDNWGTHNALGLSGALQKHKTWEWGDFSGGNVVAMETV